MSIKNFGKYIIGVCMVVMSFVASAKDFVMVGAPIDPPWKYYEYNNDLEMDILVGIDIDLLREIQRRTNIKFEFKNLTFLRSLIELDKNSIDMITGVSKSIGDKNGLKIAPWPYLDKIKQNVYYSTNNPETVNVERYKDLYKYKVGFVKNFSYDNRIEEDPLLMKEFSDSANELFRKLANNHIDVIVTGEWEYSYYNATVNLNDGSKILPCHTLSQTVDRYFAYGNQMPQYMRKKIEDALDQIIEDGTLDKIQERYYAKFHQPALSTSNEEDSQKVNENSDSKNNAAQDSKKKVESDSKSKKKSNSSANSKKKKGKK